MDLKHRFQFFFLSRGFSTIGDEIVSISLPIFIALSMNMSSSQFGQITFTGFLGELLGFLVVPWLCTKVKSSVVAIGSDVIQVLIFVIAGVFFYLYAVLPLFYLFLLYFVTAICTSIWFASTEIMITRLTSPANSQQIHRFNLLSTQPGDILGPAIGGFLFGIFGLLPILLFNVFSFLGQAFALLGLRKFEPHIETKALVKQEGIWYGIKKTITSRDLWLIIAIPLLVKFLLFGFLPFLIFDLITMGVSKKVTGLILSCFGIGLLIGSLSYRPVETQKLKSRYILDVLALGVLLTVLFFLRALFFHEIFVASLLFFIGIETARYGIELRSIRQIMVHPQEMSSVVSGMALLSRVIMPFSGLFYGYILLPSTVSVLPLIGIFSLCLFVLISVSIHKNLNLEERIQSS